MRKFSIKNTGSKRNYIRNNQSTAGNQSSPLKFFAFLMLFQRLRAMLGKKKQSSGRRKNIVSRMSSSIVDSFGIDKMFK